MQNPETLFELVKSLNATEKRYFQVYATRFASDKQKSNYQRLFDDLNNWTADKYSDTEFRKKFRKRSYMKNFAWEKNQLFELILKVMRNYRTGTDPEIRAHEMMIDVQFLLSKNRMLEAYRMLEKLYELAEDAELFAEQMNVLNYMHNLNIRSSKLKQITAAEFELKENELLEKVRLQRQVRIYNSYLFEIDRNDEWQLRRQEAERLYTQLEECAKHPLLPKRSRLMYLACANTYHDAMRNYEAAFEAASEVVALLKNPEYAFLSQSPSRIISGYGNYLAAAMMLERFDLYPPILAELKQLKCQTDLEEMERWYGVVTDEIIYLMNVKKYESIDELIKYTDSGIAKYANKLPEGKIITLNCNLSLLCFFSRNYIQSQKYINQLLDYVGRSSRYNFITVLMRTLELINHLLLREYDLADMKWRSYRRLIQQQSPSLLLDYVTEAIGKKIHQADNRPPDVKTIDKVLQMNPTSQWIQLLAIMQQWPVTDKGNHRPQ